MSPVVHPVGLLTQVPLSHTSKEPGQSQALEQVLAVVEGPQSICILFATLTNLTGLVVLRSQAALGPRRSARFIQSVILRHFLTPVESQPVKICDGPHEKLSLQVLVVASQVKSFSLVVPDVLKLSQNSWCSLSFELLVTA
jgi:hypothetical protein